MLCRLNAQSALGASWATVHLVGGNQRPLSSYSNCTPPGRGLLHTERARLCPLVPQALAGLQPLSPLVWEDVDITGLAEGSLGSLRPPSRALLTNDMQMSTRTLTCYTPAPGFPISHSVAAVPPSLAKLLVGSCLQEHQHLEGCPAPLGLHGRQGKLRSKGM